MAKKDLQVNSHSLDKRAWWYEEDDGLCIVIEAVEPKTARYIATVQRTIPWALIRLALGRLDRRARKPKRPAPQHDEGRKDA